MGGDCTQAVVGEICFDCSFRLGKLEWRYIWTYYVMEAQGYNRAKYHRAVGPAGGGHVLTDARCEPICSTNVRLVKLAMVDGFVLNQTAVKDSWQHYLGGFLHA